jgi:hypothetical protein
MIMNIKVFIKNLLFLCLLMPISLSALAQKKPFEAEIKAFAKSDSIVVPLQGKIVFVGSSSFASGRISINIFLGIQLSIGALVVPIYWT